jgi:hypothetical protein
MIAKYVDTLDAELEQRIQLKDGEMRRQKPKLSGTYEPSNIVGKKER